MIVLFSQKVYTPDWESLDKRPVPSWFEDAKFGIFIHWGLYSVPGWSPKGTYSEWYKYWLENKKLMGNGDFTGTEIYDFHTAMYGRDFTYADFAPMFKAMSYDANEWAKLFERAGARYAVLTTKHHDGFALWPSKEASTSYGRPWNSMVIGAHRDLVGEYVDALRKTNIKVGCYFSLREWGNPLYTKETMGLFYEKHFFPQLKDLVNTYKPDLIWSDGPDAINDKEWQVERTLAWLIEKYAGKFPTWLAPVQAKVLPVSDKFADYAKQVAEALKASGVRVEVDDRDEKLGYKIRQAQLQKVPYMLILEEKEQSAGTVSVRKRDLIDENDSPELGTMSVEEFAAIIKEESQY